MIKTYGVKQSISGRWFIVCDNYNHYNLSYVKKDFALKKAESFTQRCFRNWKNIEGYQLVNYDNDPCLI
jgi:hypothetical protein